MEEIIYVVDEKDQFVRKATRMEVREKALLHRAARVIIINNEGKYLIQKRSATKDIHPSMWDIGVAETVKNGDSYESTAMRGLLEELGIVGISNIQMMHSVIFKLKYFSQNHHILCKVYKLTYSGQLHLQEEEIDEIKFLTKEEVANLIEKTDFNPVGKIVFNKYVELKPIPSNKYPTIEVNEIRK